MVFELLAFLILPLILGINGIWCAVAVAEMAAFFVSWILLISQNKNYQYL
jgi:Na+-driven multidrug efflux pump